MLSSPTEFIGINFTLADGTTKFVRPHPEVKAEVEEYLNPPTGEYSIEAPFSSKLLDELTASNPDWKSALFTTDGKFRQMISRQFYEDCKRLDEETRPLLEKMVWPFTLEEYSNLIKEKEAKREALKNRYKPKGPKYPLKRRRDASVQSNS